MKTAGKMSYFLMVLIFCAALLNGVYATHIISVSEGLEPNMLVHDITECSSMGSADLDILIDIGNGRRTIFETYFTSNNAVITTRRHLSRDEIAIMLNNPHLPVVFEVTCTVLDPFNQFEGQVAQHTIQLQILDVNNNAPSFDVANGVKSIEIPETEGGQHILDLAIDNDQGENSTQTYLLMPPPSDTNPFTLDVRRNEANLVVSLRLNIRSLDRETQSNYTLYLIARENTTASPNPPANLTIQVIVQDVCDESPMFESSRFQASIEENSPARSTVLTNVSAIDNDLLDQGRLMYSIRRVCSVVSEGGNCLPMEIPPFELDREAGDLTILLRTNGIDREDFVSYMISIIVADTCGSSTSAIVEVTIGDVNDNPPEVEIYGPRIIPETNLVDSVELFVIEVQDRDYGRNPPFNISMQDNSTGIMTESEVFYLSFGNRLVIKNSRPLDREERSSYLLVLNTTDAGIPSLSTITPLSLTIGDINDNSPIFDAVQPVFEIVEEPLVGIHRITTVTARDADSVESGNGHVIYTIPPSNDSYPFQDYLRVEENGEVIVARRLDREQQDNFFVLVEARDNATTGEPRKNYVVINVTLTDRNDVTPTIYSLPSNIMISETEPNGTVVFTVLAYDNDTDPYSTLTYSLTPDNTPFMINSATGEVTLVSPLDYETTTSYSLKVSVSDQLNTANKDIEIFVQNVNDERCIFDDAVVYSTSVREGEPPNYRVFTIRATDRDTQFRDLTFSILDGNKNNSFSITHSTATIHTTYSLDNEGISNYTLTIECSDGSMHPTTTQLFVQVLDVNDNLPVFDQSEYSFMIFEKFSANSPVGRVHADDLDSGSNGVVRYSIAVAVPSGTMSWFHINPNDGMIFTSVELDRESPLLEGTNGVVQLTVSATDMPTRSTVLQTLVNCNITVLDRNDNAPVFQEQTRSVAVSESLLQGASLPITVMATDRDSFPFNVITYEISENTVDGRKFALDMTTGVLTLQTTLDYEQQQMHRFQVQAIDADMRSLRAYQWIIVNVTNDVERNIRFEGFDTAVAVRENVPINHTVTQFQVTDQGGDTPIMRGSTVIFSIIDISSGIESQDFGLANDSYNSTLVVYVKSNIDRESFVARSDGTVRQMFNITASSEDHGSVSAIMTITILDENDNYPVFSDLPYSFTVHENNDISVSIGTVSATDMDFGNNGSPGITYSVDHPLFVVAQDGELKSTVSLDYEEGQHLFDLMLTASDGGSPPKTKTVPVRVTVIDENDNSPQFYLSNNRTFYIREDIPVNSIVDQLMVSDRDSGIFGEVNVSMGNIPSQHFEIRPNGDIKLVRELDRERVPSHFFTVVATDGGGRKTTAEITVVVEDYNDNKPVFNSIHTIVLNETQPSNQVFYTVTATDQDIGPNAMVRYAIGDRSLSTIFCINPGNGDLSLCPQHFDCPDEEIPNYEHRMRYDLNVVAYDLGTPRNIVSQNITVIIMPVNEHTPQFDRSLLFVYVDETNRRDVEVATIQAVDLDEPEQISYEVRGIDRSAFRYDVTRNSLISNVILNYNKKSSYSIILVATDSGGRTDSINVFIYVININDHPPVIDSNSLPSVPRLVISENTPVATVVWRVQAFDEDDDNFDAVEYHLQNPLNDMRFRIDPLTGEILVNATLDHEETDTYNLYVFATDKGTPQHTSSPLVAIWISVVDENDERVMFNASSYTFNVPENMPTGTNVGQLYASDRDGAGISYSIVEGINDYFDINAQNGYIFTLREIDRESMLEHMFSLRVHAIDGAPGSQDTAMADVIVNIVDVNDNPPILSSKLYQVSIPPDQQVDSFIPTTISSSDRDSGSYAQYHYEVQGPSSNLRITVRPSGQLVLNEPVPRDNFQLSYSYTLTAVDNNNASLFSTAVLELLVETAGDHHPRFSQYETVKHVHEDLANGTLIITVSSIVSDEDGDTISYSFMESYPMFNIDPVSGGIVLNGMLDYELVREYSLTVLATDSRPGMHRTSMGIIRVIVDPVNEHAPTISQLPSQYVFSYISITGIELFTVSAIDPDQGEDSQIEYTLTDPTLSLAIDRQHGTVRNQAALNVDEDFEVTISACDCGTTALTSQVAVRISVRDPGANKPVISGENPRIVRRPENTGVGMLLNSELVSNPMAQTYHLVKQTLFGNTNPVHAFSITGANGRLVLKEALDYEEANMYSLVVEARVTTINSTSEVRASDFLPVIYEVTNVNDNDPVFTPVPRQSFPEDITVGSPLFRVEATDRDLGPEGTLTYDFCQGSTDGTFGINRTSGQVKLERALDREIVSDYTLCIQASDSGNSRRSAQIRVRVDVTDVNDYVTTFGNRNYSLSVYEYPSTVQNTRVMKLSATDLDEGQLRYTMTLQEVRHMSSPVDINRYYGAFTIDPFTGSINVGAASLDRETTDTFLYLVTATDDINTAQTYLTIHILDVDDNLPELSLIRSVRVTEGTPPDALVTDEIMVSDRDEGVNGWVRYSLGRNWPGDYFKIDPLSGVIRVNRQIVYENPSFEGEVIAQGQGSSSYRANGTIEVIIEDVNNHAPMFENSSIVFMRQVGSMSSAEVWSELHQFSVEDRDFAVNALPVAFSIPSYYLEERENFRVTLSEGKGVLEIREPQTEIKTYNFQIDVWNSFYNPVCARYMQASSINVTVKITPVNIGAPQFTQTQYSFEVFEEQSDFSQSIGRVEATDVDGDSISFSLTEVSVLFRMERNGYLYATGLLDREIQSSYMLTVEASDSGFPSMTNSARITIVVEDINDNSPIFTRSVYDESLMENSPINTTVLSVSAYDEDFGENAQVIYQINDDIPFSIGRTTGAIVVSGSIDYEDISSYSFQVIAYDGGSPPRSSKTLVNISLTDVNEAPPTFAPPPQEPIVVDVSVVVGEVVYTVKATDPDVSEELMFSFVNSEPNCYLNINSKTGEITLKDSSVSDSTCPSQQVMDPAQPDRFLLDAIIQVSDGMYKSETTLTFSLHHSIVPVPTEKPSSLPIEIISATILGVVIVILIFVVIVIIACICRWKKKSKYVVDDEARPVEMKRFGSNRSHSSTANGGSIYKQTTSLGVPPEHTTVSLPTGSGASSARHSYIGNMESEPGNERGSYHSPATLSGKSHLKTCRSTSDLGSSTMNTDMMSGNSQENTLPYDNPQIKRIYAKNADLLDDQSGSNESIHMFGSEGGGESDGGDDLYSKFNEYDDDDDSTTMQDDDEEDDLDDSIPFRRRDSLGLSIDPVEVPCYNHDNHDEVSWSPRITNMAETIDQIAYETGPRHSQHFMMDGYSKSQEGMSGYSGGGGGGGGGGGTQDSSHPLLRDNHRLMHHQPHHMVQQQPDFYYDDHGQDARIPDHHMMRGPPPNYSASSSTGLPSYSSHDLQRHPMGRHPGGGGMGVPPMIRGASQEVPPMYDYHNESYFHHPLHHDMGTAGTHSPSSTPTEEALNTRHEYESDIMFSSDTSLNTNTESEQFRQQQQLHQQMRGPPRGFSQSSQRGFSQSSASQRHPYR